MKLVFEKSAFDTGYNDLFFADDPIKSKYYEFGSRVISLMHTPAKGVELEGLADAESLADGLALHALRRLREKTHLGFGYTTFGVFSEEKAYNALLLEAKLRDQIAQGGMTEDVPFTFVADHEEAGKVLRDVVPMLETDQEGLEFKDIPYRSTDLPILSTGYLDDFNFPERNISKPTIPRFSSDLLENSSYKIYEKDGLLGDDYFHKPKF